MNKERRKELGRISDEIVDAAIRIRQLYDDLQVVHDAEEEAYDNLPESLQQGERGESTQTAIDNMDSALTELESLADSVDEIVAQIEKARE